MSVESEKKYLLNIQEGDLIIVHEDNTPPQQWALARVII